MVKDVINKVRFDVHCTSEATAKSMQKEISNFTLTRISRIIDDLLKKANTSLFYKIDRIEIELGEINLNAFSSTPVLEILQNKLEEALQQKLRHTSGDDRTVLTGDEADWDILKSYLLHGDLPWWVDKTQDTDIQRLARHISTNHPEWVLNFIEHHANETNVKERLKFLEKRIKNIILEEKIAGTSNGSFLLDKITSGYEINLAASFPAENSEAIALRQAITDELAKDLRWIELAGNFSSLTDYQRRKIKLLREGDQKNLLPVLKTLSLLQLGHLLFAPNSNLHEFTSASQEVSFKISRPLATPASRTLFKRWKEANRMTVKSLKALAIHRGVLRYDLLSLIAENENPFINNVRDKKQEDEINSIWNKTRKLLSRSFDQLTDKQRYVYHELIRNGYSDRRNEINTMKQLLQDLPPQSLKLITFLADLINDQIIETDWVPAIERRIETNQRTLVIGNAGLCLIASYLPSLFKELGYLDDKMFRTRAFAMRAIRLLEYIVTGKRSNPEYRLQLNKILCGCNIAEAIGGYKRFRKKEVDESDELIRAVIRNWKVLNNTSIGGFRDSFLQRKGILTENENSWTLRVERKSYDMLLNSLPWSFNMIKLPWMTKMIEVEW